MSDEGLQVARNVEMMKMSNEKFLETQTLQEAPPKTLPPMKTPPTAPPYTLLTTPRPVVVPRMTPRPTTPPMVLPAPRERHIEAIEESRKRGLWR